MKKSRSKTGKSPLARALEKFRAGEAAKPAKRQAARDRQSAYDARDALKPRKSDRGKFLFVDTKGKREPGKQNRKGYLIYVTRTGKKWLIKEKLSKQPFRARKKSKLILPAGSRLRTARQAFERSRLVTVHRQSIVKGSGSTAAGGAHDFSTKVSDKIAASVRKVVGRQASQRIFLVKFSALVKLPDGATEVIQGEVPIEYPDHVAISSIGVKAWVRHKFYSFMARELAYTGYVSAGSSNHIRSLSVNQGKPRRQWKDSQGEPWIGRQLEQVEIIKIDWKIEQAK